MMFVVDKYHAEIVPIYFDLMIVAYFLEVTAI